MGRRIKGAGDIVASVTKFVGIKPCEACEERRKKWNNMFPIRVNKNIRDMTPEEIQEWNEFKEVVTLRLTDTQAKYLCTIYASVFNVPYYEPCKNCSPKPYITMIERMDKIVETYNN